MKQGVRRLALTFKDQIRRKVARRRFVNSIRPSDVFVVTYPKSGTTWLGFLIANVLKTDPQEQLDLRSFVKYVPDINRVYCLGGSLRNFEMLPDPRFFSVHAPYDPSFPKVVYLLRDPRDIAVSYWHHRRLANPDFDLSMNEFIVRDDHWRSRWDEHVTEWLLDHKHPALSVVTYEQMHQETGGVLKRVLDFSGVRYTSADIKRAVEASRFDKMSKVETKFGWEGFVPERGRFVRRGQVGVWKDELDKESLRVLEEKYSKVMCEVGYEPTTKQFDAAKIGPSSHH